MDPKLKLKGGFTLNNLKFSLNFVRAQSKYFEIGLLSNQIFNFSWFTAQSKVHLIQVGD